MKKHVIPLLLGLALPGIGLCQQLTPSVVANAGGYDKNQQLSLEWTLGEAFVETVTTTGRIYTQGFHQPQLRVEEMPEVASPYRVRIAPNPVVAILNVVIESEENTKLLLNLTDMTGHTYYSKSTDVQPDPIQVDMKALPSGVYILQVATPQGQPVKTVKVVKQ
ncbi:T9SS type A sorting domain-containing protein [Spirosoma luteum]|uniref:T9SS type A sorting domain-containing protein n=1 Tax=Spirosoma luteum TaxID=431553 RepID=UPI0003A4E184|nr:T9SS type A sorting domain-containing protein [Spirosoma luteum]